MALRNPICELDLNPDLLINSQKLDSAAPKATGASSCRVIAITSGKGGVGKSSVAINLAVELSRQGKKVCVFDADTNLANINIMTGLSPEYTLYDLLDGKQTLSNLLLQGPEGVRIVPAASGIADFVSFQPYQQARLINAIRQLESSFDIILIDTAAGISESVLSFVQAAGEVILTITTEPTSLTDAFSLLKVLKKQGYEKPIQVLINKAEDLSQAKKTLLRFSQALKKYLGLRVIVPGYVLEDANVPRSVMVQRPFTVMYPNSAATRCVRNIALRLQTKELAPYDGMSQWLQDRHQSGSVKPQAEKKYKVSDDQWLTEALQVIQQAPISEVENYLSQISQHWIARIDQERLKLKQQDDRLYRSAIHFASLLNHKP